MGSILRVIAASTAIALLALIAAPFTSAALTAALARSTPASVGAGSWGVVAVAQGGAPTTGSLQINWANIKGVPYGFIDVVNVSTFPTTGQTFTVQTVATSNGNSPIPVLTMDACMGATWTTSNTCAGTITRMGTTANGSFSSNVAVASGARLSVRVTSSGAPGANFLSTIDMSISRAQVRAALTTNG